MSAKQYITHIKRNTIVAKGNDQIIFTGPVRGKLLQELYSNTYMFLLPSNLEGMANTLLEAMSYGNCCLVSDIPENTEVVQDKAITFEKGNEKDLQDKLQYLLDHPDVVEKYKKNSSQYILERYSWDKVVCQMLNVYSGNVIEYEDVLNGNYDESSTFSGTMSTAITL